MNEIKISIITVCYNSEKTISQTIESLLNQSFINFEYIIIDGKSKDETLKIIESYFDRFLEKKISYKYISEEDAGIYDAMNKGINLSRGELIGIINSDDWYEEDALENIYEAYLNNNLDIVYGLLRTIDLDNKPEQIIGLYKKNGIGLHPTVFIKKEVYNKYGKFDLSYRLASDTELLIRLSDKNLKIKMLEKIISNFRLDGATSKNSYLSCKEYNNIIYKYKKIGKKEKIIRDLYNYLNWILNRLKLIKK